MDDEWLSVYDNMAANHFDEEEPPSNVFEVSPTVSDGSHTEHRKVVKQKKKPVAGAVRNSSHVDASKEVLATWLGVMSAATRTGADPETALRLVSSLRNADVLYQVLDKGDAKLCQETIAVVLASLSDLVDGEVWLDSLGLFTGHIRPDVETILLRITNMAPAPHPESSLAGAMFLARKTLSKSAAQTLIDAIDGGTDPERLAELYQDIPPPSAIDGGAATGENPTVASLHDLDMSSQFVFSSGFRTLDEALHTRPEYPKGFVRSGQLCLLVAPSGAGKTSAMNTIVVAMALDMIAQGSKGQLLYHHNEDDTQDIFDSMGIGPGKRYNYLAESIAFVKTTSRLELLKMFYLAVLRAKRLSLATGLPITMTMPPCFVTDYFQALSEAGENETQSSIITANLLLYGIANCDPIALANYGGMSFQEFTGEAWPDGLEGFNIAVVATAQLLIKGNAVGYEPDRHDWRNYAVADAADQPSWEPLPGDAPLASKDDIRGATTILQHATTMIALHRPKHQNNPPAGVDSAGWPTLADSRGFFTILKARFGQNMLVIPMEFNLQRNGGSKAQYIDRWAERAIMQPNSKIEYDQRVWLGSGDPILPIRPTRTKAHLVRY